MRKCSDSNYSRNIELVLSGKSNPFGYAQHFYPSDSPENKILTLTRIFIYKDRVDIEKFKSGDLGFDIRIRMCQYLGDPGLIVELDEFSGCRIINKGSWHRDSCVVISENVMVSFEEKKLFLDNRVDTYVYEIYIEKFTRQLQETEEQMKTLKDLLVGALVVHENARDMLAELDKAGKSIEKMKGMVNNNEVV